MDMFWLVLTIFLAGVLFTAGAGKLLDRKGAERSARRFGVPGEMAGPFAVALPLVEIALAFLLVYGPTFVYGAAGAALLLTVFTLVMAWQMVRGRAPDCHCFGQLHSEPVGVRTLLRNAGLILLALLLLFNVEAETGFARLTGIADPAFVLGLALAGMLFVLLLLTNRMLAGQREIVRRMEMLEILAGEGGFEQSRAEAGSPHEGLPIGSPLPGFELPSTSGRTVTRDDVIAGGRPVILLNVSPTCAPCEQLLPEFGEWEQKLSDRVDIVYISRGTARENVEKFGPPEERLVLLQEDRELSGTLEIRWTPTALLVNRNGVVASHPAAGDAAIRDLFERIEAEDLETDLAYIAPVDGEANGMRIGETVPEFSLSDLRGEPISDEYFRGRRTLVTFWSRGCPHCVEMIDELREWDRIRGLDDPELVVFSDSTDDDHADLELRSPVVIDPEHAVSDRIGMYGTPSAVLVDEDGRIVSETATGAGRIWALVGKRRPADRTDAE